MDCHVNSVSFNQTGDCCAYATTCGFCIHTMNPQEQSIRRDVGGRSLGLVEMLYSTNIMVLVGANNTPTPADDFPCTKAIIWDDVEERAIGELCHETPVKSVRLGTNRIAVCLENAVHVYDMENLQQLYKSKTIHSPLGLLAMTIQHDTGMCIVAHLGGSVGEVLVASDRADGCTFATRSIHCHKGHIASLALSPNGRYLATASVKGTLIRIFSTEDGSMVEEVRRGTQPATIHSLAFSFDAPTWLACTSDGRTMHMFHLSLESIRDTRWIPWWKSPKRSCLQFPIDSDQECLVSFHAYHPDTVTLLSKTGMYQRVLTLVQKNHHHHHHHY